MSVRVWIDVCVKAIESWDDMRRHMWSILDTTQQLNKLSEAIQSEEEAEAYIQRQDGEGRAALQRACHDFWRAFAIWVDWHRLNMALHDKMFRINQPRFTDKFNHRLEALSKKESMKREVYSEVLYELRKAQGQRVDPPQFSVWKYRGKA